jgi:hypothetical protein
MAAIQDTAFVFKQTITSSDQTVDLQGTRTTISLTADTDCFVNFENSVTTTNRYLIKANTPVTVFNVMASTLHVLGTSGNLYIAAFRK